MGLTATLPAANIAPFFPKNESVDRSVPSIPIHLTNTNLEELILAKSIVSAARTELNPHIVSAVQHPLFTDFVSLELGARFPNLQAHELHAAVLDALERASADLAADLISPQCHGGSGEVNS